MAIARVQATSANWGSASNTQALAFASSTATTNHLIAVFGLLAQSGTLSAPPLTSVTDSALNTWVIDHNHVSTGDTSLGLAFAHCANATGAATLTVTANLANSCYGGMAIAEYSGVATTSPLDQAVGTDPGYATSLSMGPLTTTQASELLVSAAASPGQAQTFTAGSGFGLATTSAGMEIALEDQSVSSAGAYTAAWTLGTNQKSLGFFATFKGTGGGTPTATASPTSVTEGSITTLTLVGTGTTWTGATTFTPSDGTVLSKTFTDATHYSLSYFAPSTVETVTITDNESPTAASVSVSITHPGNLLLPSTIHILPTYQMASIESIFTGDSNLNGTLAINFRKNGASSFEAALPPWRIGTNLPALITGVTSASPPVVTAANSFSAGNAIRIAHVGGTVGINGSFLVAPTPRPTLTQQTGGTIPVGTAVTVYAVWKLGSGAIAGAAPATITLTGSGDAVLVAVPASPYPGVTAVDIYAATPSVGLNLQGTITVSPTVGGSLTLNAVTSGGASFPASAAFSVINLDGSAVTTSGTYTAGSGQAGLWQSPQAWYGKLFYLAALGASSAQPYDLQLVYTDADGISAASPVQVTTRNTAGVAVTTQTVTPVLSSGNTVSTITITNAFSTLADVSPDPTTLTPTYFVDGTNGADTNAGTTVGAAWRTLAHAVANAPANAVVGVVVANFYAALNLASPANGVTFIPVNGSGVCTSATLPVVASTETHSGQPFTRMSPANEGNRAVVDPGYMTIPTGATANNGGGRVETIAPWKPVNVSGVADPTQTYRLYKWAATGINNGAAWGCSTTRTGEPFRLAQWQPKTNVYGALAASTPPGPDGLGYNIDDPSGWAEFLHDPRNYQFGSYSPGLTVAAVSAPTIAPTLTTAAPTTIADPTTAPSLGVATGYPAVGSNGYYYPMFGNSAAHTIAYAYGNRAGWTKASPTAALTTTSTWTSYNSSSTTSHYQPMTTAEVVPAGTTKLGIFVDGHLQHTVLAPTVGVAATFNVAGPAVLGRADAIASPVVNTTAGAIAAGVVTVGYTYRGAGGETVVSPTQTVTVSAGGYITAVATALPSGALGVGWYASTVVGNTTLGLVAASAGTTATFAATGNAAVVPPATDTSAVAATDAYVRVPTPTTGSGGGLPEQDPRTLYVSMYSGDSSGSFCLNLGGTGQRVSGFEFRSAVSGVRALSTSSNSAMTHNLVTNCWHHLDMYADKGGTPNTRGDACLIEYNCLRDTLLWSTDQTDRSMIPWNWVKGDFGILAESQPIEVDGGVTRATVRRNTITGTHDSGPVWESGYDRYSGYGLDFYLNISEQHQDDGPEAGDVGMNIAFLHNYIADTLTGVSVNNGNFGPVYAIRNLFDHFGSEGEPVDYTQPAGEQSSVPQGNALKWGNTTQTMTRLYAIGNTFYGPCVRAVTDLWGLSWTTDTNGSFPSAGSNPVSFYWRNNIFMTSWDCASIPAQYPAQDPQPPFTYYDGDYDAFHNWVAANSAGAVVGYNGGTYGTIATLRTAENAILAMDAHSQPWGTGAFTDDPTAQFVGLTTGNQALVPGSGFVDTGGAVPNIANKPLANGADFWANGGGYYGTAPDLGAVEYAAVVAIIRRLLGMDGGLSGLDGGVR